MFLWYGCPTKGVSLISNRDHCQRSSPSRISDTPRAGFEPAQNLSSGFVEWSCAVVITTTPRHHKYFHRSSWCCGANNWHITMHPVQFNERRCSNSTRKLLPIWNVSRFKKLKNNFRTGCFAFRNRVDFKIDFSQTNFSCSKEKFWKEEISF